MQVHPLAAHRMFKLLSTDEGKHLSAMAFVLRMRVVDCVRFWTTPAVLMVIYSGRLGARGLTILHFREADEPTLLEQGSSNANFLCDFSPTADVPKCDTRIDSYEDLLDAVHGHSSLFRELCFEHMRKLTSRLRTFVSKNRSADPDGNQERMNRTLQFVNKFLGATLGHLQKDTPSWWNDYSDELRNIDYHLLEWSVTLVNTALTCQPVCALTPSTGASRPLSGPRNSRDQKPRVAGMPDEVRKQTPRNA